MKVKKALLVLLCLAILAASALTGCGKKQATDSRTSTGTQTTAASPEPYTLPLVKDGSVTLTIGTYDNWYTPASYKEKLPVFDELEKKTGVKVKWDVVPIDNADTVIQTRLAAGSNLPDITYIPWIQGLGSNPAKFGVDGIVIPMEDLINNYAPNIVKFFFDNPHYRKQMTAPDGHIYGLGQVMETIATKDPFVFSIRKDWLDKLKVPVPTTLDEWYTALKAIKTGDPNGNGKADEIPLSVDYKVWGLAEFGGAYGLHLFYNEGFYADKDGKVQYDWLDPKAKELLQWLHKLYAEGLIDPEFLNTSYEQVTAKIDRNIVGACNGSVSYFKTRTNALKKSGIADANLIPVLPASSVLGGKGIFERRHSLSDNYSITKDCKNKEIAIKYLDYLYASEEGLKIVNYGVEGKSYTMVDGVPKLTDFVLKNPDGLSAGDALKSIGCTPNISSQNFAVAQLMDQDQDTTAYTDKLKEYTAMTFPQVIPTQEEADKVNALNTDINTYRDETAAKLIIGTESFDNWDKFTTQLRSLGIDEILKIKQQQYDRYNKN